jgi:hypothetical protein
LVEQVVVAVVDLMRPVLLVPVAMGHPVVVEVEVVDQTVLLQQLLEVAMAAAGLFT